MSEGKHTPNTWEGFISHVNSQGGTAFPASLKSVDGTEASLSGMTLRDYFAGQALAGMDGGWTPMFDWSVLTDGDYGGDEWHARARSERARYAYGQADAMLAERSK